MRTIILTTFLALPFSLFVQGIYEKQRPIENPDKKQVEEVILGYIENFFLNDYEKMEVFLHERLSKRGVNIDGTLSGDYSKEDLRTMLSNNRAMPLSMQKNIVSEIFIDQRVATAVLETGYPNTRWKEYIHLAKLDGKWIIADVFWCFENIQD